MNDYFREFIAASKRLKVYIRFTVANGMAHPDDLAIMQSWLDALSRYEKKGSKK